MIKQYFEYIGLKYDNIKMTFWQLWCEGMGWILSSGEPMYKTVDQ
jgi:hypothetical protein